MTSRLVLALFLLPFSLLTARANDWTHWRGPEQTGQAKGVHLPATFGLETPGKDNLLWKSPVGGRSAPIKLGDKLFFLNGTDPGELTEGERVSCLDTNTGKTLWEYRVNVYHSDVVTSRLGWTTLTADPEHGRVYAHTTAGALLCLDTNGKLVWERQLSEEFGRFTGYGGRIVSPIYDSGLVIVAIINSSWGDMARGANRFLAFDAATGAVAWISEPTAQNKDTYQSHPVIAVINGQRVLIAGGGDGALHAIKVRTGEKVWSYLFCAKAVNPAPVVSGNLVYSAHGDENPEGGPIGRVICVDGSKVDPKTKKPKLVWEYRRANRFGLSHPALADGRLYIPDDSSELFCFNAATGKVLWKYKYGTVSRGAPLVVGDKLYIFDVNAKLSVITLHGDKAPDEAETVEYTFRVPAGASGFAETHGTPIAVDGKLIFCTQYETYCVAEPNPKPDDPGAYKPLPPETPFDANAAPAAVRILPFESDAKAGGTVPLKLEFIDANGRAVTPPAGAMPQWSLPTPPPPPNAKNGPPPLKGTVAGEGLTATVVLDKAPPAQNGYVAVKAGDLTARARVRVVPQIPYKQDFENVPEGATPGGWVNTQGKFVVKKLPDGAKVLSKVNTDGRPPIARANAYITLPTATGYTIEADLLGTEVFGKLPDMGVVANRYTLILDGKKDPEHGRSVRLASWDARPRVNKVVPFDWKKDTWYRLKFTVDVGEKTATVRGKVWERGQPEPDAWTVTFDDPSPNREGAAALFGYVSNVAPDAPGSDIYYDNVVLTPNKK
jgi:outer membrane protein assembly factor BamB